MNYIVIDLEWNQCPEGKEKEEKQLPFEIIEIAAAKTDRCEQGSSYFHEYIKPVIYRELHHKTREVIQIDSEVLQQGKNFKTVMQEFMAWCGKDYIFATWGSMDLTELQRNMRYFDVHPLLPRPLFYYDIQKLFSRCFDDGRSRVSLENAVEYLKIEKKKPFHHADADVYYTVKIMEKLDWERVEQYRSLDYFSPPVRKEEEVYMVYPDYSKYVSRVFDSKEEAMQDRNVAATKCYMCHKNIKKKIRWFSCNNRIYYSLVYCDVHGWMRGKIQMKKTDEGKIFAVKTLKPTDNAGAARIYLTQEEVRKKRRERRKQKD